MRSPLFIVLLLTLGVAGGCAVKIGNRDEHLEPYVPTTRPGDPFAATQSDRMFSNLAPQAAARVVSEAIESKFDLTSRSLSGDVADFARRDGPSDYFGARFEVRTLAGGTLRVLVDWLDEGRTQVVLASDLPGKQHAILVAEVRRALAEAAPLPAAGR